MEKINIEIPPLYIKELFIGQINGEDAGDYFVDFLNDNFLTVFYEKIIEKNPNNTYNVTRKVYLVKSNVGVVGNVMFSSYSIPYKEPLDKDLPVSISISLESFKGNKLSKLLIGLLISKCKDEISISDNRVIGIEIDTSGGFWDSIIGMNTIDPENPHFESDGFTQLNDEMGFNIFEKIITFGDLSNWATNMNMRNKKIRAGKTKRRMRRRRNSKTMRRKGYKLIKK